LAIALLLVAAGSFFLGLRGHEQPLPGPVSSPKPSRSTPASPRSTTSPTETTAPTTTTSTAPAIQFALRSTPVSLRVPAIALDVSLSTLGLNLNGTVQVPTDIQQPGWYRLGPSPGQDGSAVILGHVDSYQGPATFFKLRTLLAGDMVYVTLADGVSAQFKVTAVDQYLKTGFPDQLVYGGNGSSSLQLVTCGGTFDTQTGHYLSNVVVYTSLVALTPTAAGSTVPVAQNP
jgi:Sortase domain